MARLWNETGPAVHAAGDPQKDFFLWQRDYGRIGTIGYRGETGHNGDLGYRVGNGGSSARARRAHGKLFHAGLDKG